MELFQYNANSRCFSMHWKKVRVEISTYNMSISVTLVFRREIIKKTVIKYNKIQTYFLKSIISTEETKNEKNSFYFILQKAHSCF